MIKSPNVITMDTVDIDRINIEDNIVSKVPTAKDTLDTTKSKSNFKINLDIDPSTIINDFPVFDPTTGKVCELLELKTETKNKLAGIGIILVIGIVIWYFFLGRK
jgi:hypothetical protein